MGTDNVELMLFPEYSTLVSAERNLEEYPLFELKARQRGSKARLFERVVEGEGGVSLRQTWRVIPSGEYGMPGPVDQDVYLAVLQLLEKRGGMPEEGFKFHLQSTEVQQRPSGLEFHEEIYVAFPVSIPAGNGPEDPYVACSVL